MPYHILTVPVLFTSVFLAGCQASYEQVSNPNQDSELSDSGGNDTDGDLNNGQDTDTNTDSGNDTDTDTDTDTNSDSGMDQDNDSSNKVPLAQLVSPIPGSKV